MGCLMPNKQAHSRSGRVRSNSLAHEARIHLAFSLKLAHFWFVVWNFLAHFGHFGAISVCFVARIQAHAPPFCEIVVRPLFVPFIWFIAGLNFMVLN